MLNTVTAVVREGKIQLLESVDLPEGSKLLVTVLPDEEAVFWSAASEASLNRIWDNPADDVYARLLVGAGTPWRLHSSMTRFVPRPQISTAPVR